MGERQIQNIRDLLIVAIAPDLHAFLQSKLGPGFKLYPPEGAMEEIVAFVIDGLTPRSIELLAALHDKRRVGDLKLEKGKLDS